MELNRDQIKKAIMELRRHGLSYGGTIGYHAGWCDDVADRITDAIALIKEQEEQIFKLENRLKECENGYEGTLFLDRCKLHDAEEKIKELTEKNERLKAKAKDNEWNGTICGEDIDQIAKEMVGGDK